MSPGSNKRQTGTVPKTKSAHKNAVPQEVVAPTRRDLQQHINDFFASVQRASKRDNNNRTPGEGTCFELENTRSCWPVRPIPRRNLMPDALTNQNDSNNAANGMSLLNSHHLPASNAAIGIVIPRTPNSTTLPHHQNQLNETAQLLHQQFNQQLLSMRVPDGAPQQIRNGSNNGNNDCAPTHMEDRLGQIQDYIRITTSLIDSINAEKASGPRPQSVTSIHTTAPNTPTYEELQNKLESSNRNIGNIKEQQQQLLRIQQAAKNQLYEMEQLRAQQEPLSFIGGANSSALPDYDNVEEVTQDVTALMTRMKALTDFIHNQNDLASSLGMDEKTELLSEQSQLQNKLTELKSKKQQMANLVNELQAMNIQAEHSFDEDRHSQSSELHRENHSAFQLDHIETLEKADNGEVDNDDNDNDHDDEDDELTEAAASGSSIQVKISEINAMKDQLKRLQDMMHTVKLIEIKNGDYTPDDEVSDEANNIAVPANENISADSLDEEQEMAERVRMLHNMTNDLRLQAVSLAAERDRLKDIKNEMTRRRDLDGSDKNFKQLQNHLNQPNITQKDHSFEVTNSPFTKKNDGGSNISASHNHIEKIDSNESPQNKKAPLSSTMHAENMFFSPNNWATATRQNASSTPSIPSAHGVAHQSDHLSLKAPFPASNPGKESSDSGAADVLNMSVEAPSSQSCSSRGFSVPPPMRSISGRESAWQKSSHEMPRVINNQSSANYENQTEQNYPWYWNYGQTCSSATPQSPHCHYHHHMCMPSMNVPTANDPMLLQQFIQTQQMLINSMSQCNQLLWDQQREISNLSNAVLLIQERLLNTNALVEAQSSMLRAESVPPNVVCTNQAPFLPRAQSEQPGPGICSPSLPPSAMPPSPFRSHHPPQQYYRNNHQNMRMLRQPLSNGGRNGSHSGIGASNGIPVSFYDSDQLHYSNNTVNAHNMSNQHGSDSTSLSNNASVNNLHQQNLTHTTSSSASNHNATNNVTALNNQVVPGIRANNYYDNFRSYSRQNLLSASSCKSNEMPDALQAHMTHNNLPLTIGNKFRNQNNQNTPPDVLNVNQQRYYHDVMDNTTTNSNVNNLKSGSSATGASAIVTCASGIAGAVSTISTVASNFCGGASAASGTTCTNANSIHGYGSTNETSNLLNSIVNNIENRCSDDQKSINSNNFDVNELKQPKMSSKMLQKGSTGGNKRTRSSHELSTIQVQNDRDTAQPTALNGPNQSSHDLNLANLKNQPHFKSSPKQFEDLKENVYHEVSALIAANESRPHFLINLFRELQLISSSDPLRKRLMQTFQDVYTQCCEQNGGTIMLSDVHTSSTVNVQNDLEHPHHGLATHGDNSTAIVEVNCIAPSMSSVCVPDTRPTINDGLHPIISTSAQNESSMCSVFDLTERKDSLNSVEATSVLKTNELAEADQENTNPSMLGLQSEADLIENDHSIELLDNATEAIGAVGGVELSALPDLAKVSAPTTEF